MGEESNNILNANYCFHKVQLFPFPQIRSSIWGKDGMGVYGISLTILIVSTLTVHTRHNKSMTCSLYSAKR